MIDDLIPIIHDLGSRSVTIYPIADVHIGSKECDMDGISALVAKIAKEPDSYAVLVGDIINNGVKDSLTNVYEETMPPSAQIDAAVELFEPIADKILGIVEGNHEARSRRAVDMSPGYVIACRLRINDRYRQNMAFLRVRLGHGKVMKVYSLLLTHGKTANKKRQFSYALEGIDAIITGHTHDGIVEKPARLVFTHQGRVAQKTLVSVTATSWLKAGGYGLANMYLPKTTSDPQRLVLEFSNSNSTDGRIRVEW